MSKVTIVAEDGPQPFTLVGLATFGELRRDCPASRCSTTDTETAQRLFGESGTFDTLVVAGDGSVQPDQLVDRRPRHTRRRVARGGVGPRRHGGEAGRSARGPALLQRLPARLRRRRPVRRRLHHLQHVHDRARPAQPGIGDAATAGREPAAGAAVGAARGGHHRRRQHRRSGLVLGVFTSRALRAVLVSAPDCRSLPAATVISSATVITATDRRLGGHARLDHRAGVAGAPDRSARRHARSGDRPLGHVTRACRRSECSRSTTGMVLITIGLRHSGTPAIRFAGLGTMAVHRRRARQRAGHLAAGGPGPRQRRRSALSGTIGRLASRQRATQSQPHGRNRDGADDRCHARRVHHDPGQLGLARGQRERRPLLPCRLRDRLSAPSPAPDSAPGWRPRSVRCRRSRPSRRAGPRRSRSPADRPASRPSTASVFERLYDVKPVEGRISDLGAGDVAVESTTAAAQGLRVGDQSHGHLRTHRRREAHSEGDLRPGARRHDGQRLDRRSADVRLERHAAVRPAVVRGDPRRRRPGRGAAARSTRRSSTGRVPRSRIRPSTSRRSPTRSTRCSTWSMRYLRWRSSSPCSASPTPWRCPSTSERARSVCCGRSE